ncbi:glycosyltransferase [Anaeromyxobacter diazotrophicus]|uniref:Colanic acid biosynthesis glycosyltransferase WcaL n=1 Tax=Anaeromyxobacter diazotrophicus TaxID=2590199 RepID=A0A7I9VIM7_9BACT|nr:glycosyltransferase [Anaeromyxobacter diazotrophicus]GEJ56261.1 colanic acid biosynthesis glycosyltransferase WcaL [Anaeromyxobacter diazotrophicus]
MTPSPEPSARVGYLMSWYPAVTETFILHEMLELRRLGVDLEIFPLFGAATGLRQPGAEALTERVHYHRGLSAELVLAQLHWLARRPRAYLGAWARAVAGNLRSPAFLAKALVVVPRAAVVARRMEARGVAHVHAHWATHPALAAYVVERLTGIGYSFTAHAHDLYLDRAMLEQKLAAARFVVTISRYNRALLERLYGPAAAARTVVIPCGVDPRLFPRRPPRSPDGLFRVACVAGLRDYKGHRWLVEACALLRDRGVPIRCVLVGDGPERAAVERQVAALGLGDRVALVGNQPQDRIRALLEGSDAMALPSVVTPAGMMDGIPVALMEAMAMGLPVVSTRVSGIPELVEDGRTGLLAPPQDAPALAAALERLHRDPPLARRLAEAGRARVLARFDLRENAARLRDHLLAAMGAPPRARKAPARAPQELGPAASSGAAE